VTSTKEPYVLAKERYISAKELYISANETPFHHHCDFYKRASNGPRYERWGAGVETQKNVRGEVGGWGRVPFNEPYAPSLSTMYDGA